MPQPHGRIAALDLIRGIAVLGILAINIAGFAGPMIATTTPHFPNPGTLGDEIAFAFGFVVFEGKMRALFTLLFGAGLLLFLDRAEAAGRESAALQMRRLGWLAVFGYLHFALLWWGDILFTYALAGFVALMFRFVPAKPLAALALAVFVVAHLAGAAASVPQIVAEDRVSRGLASPAEAGMQQAAAIELAQEAQRELEVYRGSYGEQVAYRLTEQRFLPLWMAIGSFAETLPLMLIGMALYRTGFFAGRWPQRRLRALAAGGLVLGGALTVAALGWLWPRDFPPVAMYAALSSWMALPHLLLALAYAALLVLAAPRLLAAGLGVRLAAAGRMAFSNYIATSLVMTAFFYGWGLGLFGTVGAAAQWLFVLVGWALMLGWSKPWLARFGQGPLERSWRRLTYGH